MSAFGSLPEYDPDLVAQSALQQTRGAAARAAFGDALDTNLTMLGWRFAQQNRNVDTDTLMSASEANDLYGIEDHLRFDRPISARLAEERSRIKRAELYRQSLIAQSEAGWATLLPASLAGSVLDPAGMALSLLPGGAIAKATPGMRSLTASTALSQRVTAGIYEGAVAGAAMESLVFPLASLREGRDYTVADSLLNIVVSGGFGGVGGALRKPGAAERAMDQASQTAPASVRQAAMEAAIVDIAGDSPVTQPRAIIEAWREAELEAARPKDAIPARVATSADAVRSDLAVTPSGRRVSVEYVLIEADQLVTSHDIDGIVNRAYPQLFQPRDRTRAAMIDQMRRIAADPDPLRLGVSINAGDGAPIIARDGVVESGNGRSIALRHAYSQGTAQSYRQGIEAMGFDTTGMTAPVLVRRRVSDLSDEDRLAFVREANEDDKATLSATEQAEIDAARLTPEMVNLIGGSDVALVGNRAFTRAFLDRVLPTGQRNTFTNADGDLSPSGAQRATDALVAYAYGDLDPILAMTEGIVPGMRGLGMMLRELAPDFARLRAAIETGAASRNADLRVPMNEALAAIQLARRMGSLNELINQTDAFSSSLSDDAYALIRVFYKDEALSRTRPVDNVRPLLRSMIDQLMAQTEGDIFGDLADVTPKSAAIEAANALARAAEAEGKPGGDYRTLAAAIRDYERPSDAGREQPGPGGRNAAEGSGNAPQRGQIADFLTAPPDTASARPATSLEAVQAQLDEINALFDDDELAGLRAEDRLPDAPVLKDAGRAAAFCLKNGGQT